MQEEKQKVTFQGSNPEVGRAGNPPVFSSSFASDLIHSMQDGFSVVDSDGVGLDANPALCQMTGFSREELVGKSPPYPYWPAEEYTTIQNAFKETLKGGGAAFELTFMRKNGQRFPVVVTAFTVEGQDGDPICYAATVQDITELNKAEEAARNWNKILEQRVATRTKELKQSESRFRRLVSATFEGIVVSKNGLIIDANQQIATMLNYEMPEMIGMAVLDFVASESRTLVARRIMDGFEGPYEFTGLRKDGTTLPMEANGRLMDWKGKTIRVSALRDLSAEKSAQARLASQKAELDQALRLALISEVSAGIIHQISQPLSAIGAHVSAFTTHYESRAVEADDFHEFLAQLADNVARMRASVIHLMALANPEQPKRLPVNYNEIVIEAIKLVQTTHERQRFVMVKEMDPYLPEILADRVQLCQVIINILSNAMDASEDLTPERHIIHITTRIIENQLIEMAVRDSGTGITPSVMSAMFNPFFTTKAKGFGVGLRLSRTIVEAHGGRIEGFNNPDGIGATFRISLPLIFKSIDTKV
jgi:PAS domain S-box-containing protein